MRRLSKMVHIIMNMPKVMLITLVKMYRLLLSPSLGSSCRFEPTCSAYSLQALEWHGAAAGSYLTLRRLVRCHPWCDGGLDPVATNFSFFSHLVTPVAASPSKKKTS